MQIMPCQRWLPIGFALQFVAMSALAGPVPIEQGAGTASDYSASTPRTLHASPSATAASSPNSIEPPGTVEASSTSSALAVEIIKEAQGDAQEADSGRNSLAGTDATKAASSNRARTGHDELSLREVGKSALRWLRMRFSSDSVDEMTELSSQPYLADEHLVGASIDNTDKEPTGAPRKAASGNPLQSMSMHQDENLVRIIIEVAHEILQHPLTWLVIALFGIGGIVVKKIDRRPKN